MNPVQLSTQSAPRSGWRCLRLSRVGVTIALITVFVLSGTGAYAFWAVTTSMKFSNPVSAGTLAVTASWSPTTEVQFSNSTTYPQVMSFTVKNTTFGSTVARTYDAVLTNSGATGGTNPLLSDLTLTLWKATNPTDSCPAAVPTSNITVGTWNSTPPIKVSGTINGPGAGDSHKWCVYSTITPRSSVTDPSFLGSTAGSVQLTPVVTATLKAGTWTGVSTLNGPVQKTNAIFIQNSPVLTNRRIVANNNFCVDVSQAAAPAHNVYVIQWTCGTQQNQEWTTTTVGATAPNSLYLRFSPRLPTGKRLSASGTAVTVQANGANNDQQWQVQERANGRFQLVNRDTRTCLTTPDNVEESRLVLSACDASIAAQEFRFMAPPREMACAPSGNTPSKTYTLSAGAATGPLTVTYNGKTQTIATGQSTVTIGYAELSANSSYRIEVHDAAGLLIDYGGISRTWFSNQVTCIAAP